LTHNTDNVWKVTREEEQEVEAVLRRRRWIRWI
jgi:hypothetical protein